MTTLQQLIERVRTFVRDTDRVFVLDSDITDWLNEAYVDLAARLKLFEQEATTTTVGDDNSLSFPVNPNLVEIKDLILGDIDHVLFVTKDIWDSYRDDEVTPPQTLGHVFDQHILLYPTPEAGTTATLFYKRLPTLLTDGSDELELPLILERKAVNYATAMAWMKTGDEEKAVGMLTLYEQGLPNISLSTETQFTGLITLTPDPNIFDLDPDALHLGR